MLSTFDSVFAVDRHGDTVGYSRPNADGAGFNFAWVGGTLTRIDATPPAINAAHQIAGWRPNYLTRCPEVVLLTPRPGG